MAERYWIETLGCPKNQVDSDKLVGTLTGDGFEAADSPEEADLVVVNTCAFIEAAREESIETVLSLADARHAGARLVVTGCMAERYGDELARALPEVDLVAPFGTPLTAGPGGEPTGRPSEVPPGSTPVAFGRRTTAPGPGEGAGAAPPSFDLLNLPRPASSVPWSYVKVAEGCDRNCGFCAIPSFRGKQRSRSVRSILDEIDQLDTGEYPLAEVVLVAQDLASFALDRSTRRSGPRLDGPAARGRRPIVDLVEAVAGRVPWARLLYLYPSALDDSLVEAVLATGVPYFDLSLQHVSRPLLTRMRRWGEGERFLERIRSIRSAEPAAAFRSSFIVGYPGETERDHDQLLAWIAEARLDWVGFFPFSNEAGTYAADLCDQVPGELVAERIRECTELQDAITASKREELIGSIDRGPGRRPGRSPVVPRGSRDRRGRRGARPPGGRSFRRRGRVRCGRARPDGRTGAGERRGRTVSGEALSPGLPAGASSGTIRRDTTFGPSALLTPANGITLLRLLATPVVIILIMVWGASWVTFVFGGLLALSDGIDGWLARRQGTTRSGAFLDPLADKVVVLGALFALVAKGIVWWLPVALIAAREIAMSVYRSAVGRHGVSVPARNSAKLKTLLQDIAIGMCLAPPLAGRTGLLDAAIWVATAMTLFTGVQYLLDGRRADRATQGHPDRQVPGVPNGPGTAG